MNLKQFFILVLALVGFSCQNNTKVYNGIIFSKTSGNYRAPFELKLENSLKQGTIYYTTNGCDPVINSAYTFEYHKPIYVNQKPLDNTSLSYKPNTLDSFPSYQWNWITPLHPEKKGCVIKAQIFEGKKALNQVATHEYHIDKITSTFDEIHLVIDTNLLYNVDSGIFVPGKFLNPANIEWSGNYKKKGPNWEKQAHLTYIRDGEILLKQNIGVRIQGLRSPLSPQKSFRLYARDKYDKKNFKFKAFENDSINKFKTLILRTPFSNWHNQFFIDAIIPEICKDMNVVYAKHKPVNTYLNGEYWGIMELTERMDEHFFERRYSIPKTDSVLYVVGNKKIRLGTSADYQDAYHLLYESDLSIDSNYQAIKKFISMDNMIDYLIIQTFFANKDWPWNNHERWKSSIKGDKWKWILVDLDACFVYPKQDVFERMHELTQHETKHESPKGFLNLLSNKDFLSAFTNRYELVLNTYLSPSKITDKINDFEQMYLPEMERHINRWQYPKTIEEFKNNNHAIRYFAKKRGEKIKLQLKKHYDISIEIPKYKK